ncbi:MAG: glycosyltransferase [Bacteroidota bacterium]
MNWHEYIPLDFSLDGPWGVVFVVFAVVWLMLMLYYWFVFSRLAFVKPAPAKKSNMQDWPPVSVIIAAKNEYYNLSSFLPAILEQQYPTFEVIVVNDASRDETSELLEDLSRKYKHLRPIHLYNNVNFFKGKKFPLSMGIRSARYQHLLLTDADCKPASAHWIREMMAAYRQDTEIVLGYGKYEEKKGLTNLLQRYDTLYTAMQYFSFALLGMPYMGVGRNLSYNRNLFDQTKGFSSHYRVTSGDDDLFINKVASKQNTQICIDHKAHTISKATASFSHWLLQKRRHLTTGRYYRFGHKFWLGLLSFSRLLFWGTLIALLIRFYNGVYVAAAGLLMLVTFLWIVKKSMNNLKEKNFWLITPLLDILLLVVYVFINFANLIRTPDKWK